ncbi:hypothetical protein ALC62_03459 [Cyphomyrmex costatus]|uniref:Uncharacterized protein n=1 Tax=Cyphomyrmex costatus TaxID=456900 RepID=A0A195CYF0_9HYME|nr:hypothetical protein ALC62_03459 [Cyphomyrmex costatus]
MRPSTRQVVNEAGDPDEEQEKQEHEVEHQQRVQPPPPPPPPLPPYFIMPLDVRRIPVCTSETFHTSLDFWRKDFDKNDFAQTVISDFL